MYNQAVGKITTLNEAIKYSLLSQKANKTVGLVVGSFDILHLGHINLFRLAKKHADVVIVGLDNDSTIKLVKGENRPVNNFKNRSQILSDLITIDKIFLIDKTSHNDSEEARDSYQMLIGQIRPTHIFTHQICDKHWKEKKRLAKAHGIKFLLDKSPKITSSGKILERLMREG